MESKYDIFEKEIASLLEQLKAEETPNADIWWEIWDTVHHQGDVWVSSYIAVPKILEIYEEKKWLDYNLPAVISVIENCRQKENNPQLPDWLKEEYFQALHKTVQYCAEKISSDWNRDFLISFLQLVCAIKQNQGLYEILNIALTEDEEKDLLDLYHKN
ncbi:MAG TPA: hypothetical protein PKE69_08795 [Pyrinomonadaceae bacterium]|nr:hypothetical protein [Pyrinomonadaceae bacterium]